MPANTATIPNTTLSAIYKSQVAISPPRISITFSKAKAENVVKPPQNPVASNNLSGWLNDDRSISAKRIPINKHPTMLTRKFAQGKP